MKNVMYIAVNQDLNMSQGKVLAQVSHAIFDFCYKYKDNTDYWMDYFKRYGDTIVVLKAHEKDLLKWEKEGYISVRDRGYTEVEPDSITAVNLGIYDKDECIPKWLQRLRLYK